MSDENVSFDLFHPEPLLVVISGPSGVGKDAAVKALMQRGLPLHFVVTMTSREPRQGEVEGVDYFFVTRQRFEELIKADEFLEYANVYEDYKGVPKAQVREAMATKRDVIMRLDVQGAKTLRGLCKDAILIFLVPSNVNEWFERLRNRKNGENENLDLRLKTAKEELEHLSEFDYVVVNRQDQLEETVNTIVSIIDAEHHRVVPRKVTL